MASEKHEQNCLVCGSLLEYSNASEPFVCTYCGKTVDGHIKCPQGHFVCDVCHGLDVKKIIEDTVFSTRETNPVRLAEVIMGHPALPMLGCEHALIAAGSIMAALKNSPYGKGRIGNGEIREVLDRTARQAVGGFCGLTGICGIVPAVGACFSVFLGSRCGSDSEQKITMDAAVRVMQSISALTGPSCCKAYVRAAVAEAVVVFGERFGIILPVPDDPIICAHSAQHPHGCRKEKCPWYRKPEKDIFADSINFKPAVCQS